MWRLVHHLADLTLAQVVFLHILTQVAYVTVIFTLTASSLFFSLPQCGFKPAGLISKEAERTRAAQKKMVHVKMLSCTNALKFYLVQ